MSSKKKQGASSPKKASFFSFGRNKAKPDEASTSHTPKAEVETTTTTYTALNTALFSSKKKENDKHASEESKKSSKGPHSHAKSKKPIITVHQHRPDAISSTPIPSLANQPSMKPDLKEVGLNSKQEQVVTTDEQRDKAAVKIQAVFKGHKERRKFIKKRQNATKVEALARGFLARKQYSKMKNGQETSTNQGVQDNTK